MIVMTHSQRIREKNQPYPVGGELFICIRLCSSRVSLISVYTIGDSSEEIREGYGHSGAGTPNLEGSLLIRQNGFLNPPFLVSHGGGKG